MKVTLKAYTQSTERDQSIGEFIAYCARVSNPANQNNTATARKLLNYLAHNKHWSPFEMASLTIEIVTTRDIGRQILRHRSFSFQEFSQRYAAVSSDGFVFREARLQDSKNRQNSIETEDEELQRWWNEEQNYVWQIAQHRYHKALERGIAKEVARAILPEGVTQSTMYVSGTIRSWIHYVLLRTEAGTQKEHRDIALACGDILCKQIPELKSLFVAAILNADTDAD